MSWMVRDQWPRLGELPFDSDRKLMSTVHRFAGGYMLVTKGAVDVMLDRTVLGPGEREEIERVNQTFSNQGLRVLALPAGGWSPRRSPWRRRTTCSSWV